MSLRQGPVSWKYAAMRLFILSLCLLVAGVFARNAKADCVSDCQASTYCGGSSYDCAHLLNACYRQECGRDNGGGSKRVSGAYGAIAYGRDSGAYGMADSSQDKAAAEKSALRYCGKHGDDCKIVESFSNTCGAVAQNVAGSVAGWAMNDDRRTAGEDALKACNKKDADGRCHIALLHCYGP
jgi:hypothetical protein